MPTKPKTKRTTKRRVAPEVPPPVAARGELPRLQIPGWAEVTKHLETEAEDYWRPWTDPKLLAGRALIDILRARNPKTPLPPITIAPTKRKRAARQTAHALEGLELLFPANKYPHGVPEALTTTELARKVVRRLKIEAENKRAEHFSPPKWDAVDKARTLFNQKRAVPTS